ncbi:hypothetical protein [Desertimonas flava]|uniref:hypothetical protein n=1 Tax=Desertimonas flava TaxID=2064846 RepID=UPI000E349ACB|nr:hypothetical protein [Desertimonas flava]
MDEDLVDSVLASPLGVCWLNVLEARAAGSGDPTARGTERESVDATVEAVASMTFGALVDAALFAVVVEAGPWIGDAPARIAEGYRQAQRRVPIAEAIATRFSDDLDAPLDRSGQLWWTDGAGWLESCAPLFERLDEVYGAGEFTFSGLWTSADPPPEAVVEMLGAWEYETGPVSRWWLPVRPEARVFEIRRPADWARLVSDHPRRAAPHPGWELPGVNQHRQDVAPLLGVTGQRAARTAVGRHLVPDWRSVAEQYDGVHLSWAGFVTAEGCISDLGDGDVTMLRYWFSERTLWLADVFGDPRPAPDPGVDLSSNSHHPPLPPRRTIDATFIRRLLGR